MIITDNCCGNYVVDGGEQCDDGPAGSATCSTDCEIIHECNDCSVCGNGIVETGEECDDGPNGSATCSSTCHYIQVTSDCIDTCDPNPNFNECDITTSCIALEGGSAANEGKHYCACRHGFRAPMEVDQMRLPWYSPISQEGRVFVTPGQACNVLCNEWELGKDGCKEIEERPLCY
jgi:hypothetical protein